MEKRKGKRGKKGSDVGNHDPRTGMTVWLAIGIIVDSHPR